MDTNDWKKLILSNEKEVKKALERAYVYGLTNSADVVITNKGENLGLITSEGKPDYYEIIEHLPVIDRRAADRINAYEAKKLAPQKADELFDEILSAKSYSITNGIPFVPFSKEPSKQSINSLFSGTPFEGFENELIGKCSYTANFDNIVETAEKIAAAIDGVELDRNEHFVGQER